MPPISGFLRKFALSAEHTWGTDTKTYLDHDHYKPADLEEVLDKSGYQKMMTSWAEKRRNIDDAVASLPVPMRAQAVGRLAKLKPVVPGTEGLNVFKVAKDLETTHFTVGIDEKTGAIRRLHATTVASGRRRSILWRYSAIRRSRRTIMRSSWRATSRVRRIGLRRISGNRTSNISARKQPDLDADAGDCWSGENDDGHRIAGADEDRRCGRREIG